MIQLKNVTLGELAAKSEDRESWKYMRLGTVLKFQAARDAYGAAIHINHAFRTKGDKKRLKMQGLQVADNSAHEQGWALDVRPVAAPLGVDLEAWKRLLDALWAAGFRRFGIMATAIHVDDDPARPAAIWGYGNTNPTVWAWAQSWYAAKTKKP